MHNKNLFFRILSESPNYDLIKYIDNSINIIYIWKQDEREKTIFEFQIKWFVVPTQLPSFQINIPSEAIEHFDDFSDILSVIKDIKKESLLVTPHEISEKLMSIGIQKVIRR